MDVKHTGNIHTSATVAIYKILYVFRHYIHMIFMTHYAGGEGASLPLLSIAGSMHLTT